MQLRSLVELLALVADSQDSRRIVAYPSQNTRVGRVLGYRELKQRAKDNSYRLSRIEGFARGSVMIIHFTDHLDNIVWFWSVLYAGCIPALSTPFSNNPSQRDKHVCHLQNVLQSPICLTRQALLGDFPENEVLQLQTVETLPCVPESTNAQPSTSPQSIDTALLMLTSGSTGDAKAVCLSHGQILSSISGKASVMKVARRDAFLNWIGLDHVAGIVEIHLHAMYVNVDQIHVQAIDLVSNPLVFLDLIHRHRVARSFAPNFFLAKLIRTLESYAVTQTDLSFDLSRLQFLVSGGEANPVTTCDVLSKLLKKHGAPENVIVPGFGMTETCAGSIYSRECPRYDLKNGHEFVCLGTCIPGIEMRVKVSSDPVKLAESNERGDLEVRGPIVFKEYYNNPQATREAFTSDGWFRTGDQALIDSAGKLNLVGRSKDTITVNGVKHSPHEIETAIEEACISGIASSHVACFTTRPQGSQTEQICVVYLPTYTSEDAEALVKTSDSVVRTVMLQTGVRPRVLPLPVSLLQKTTLGKLSRSKIKVAMERGLYKSYQDYNDAVMKDFRTANLKQPENTTEWILVRIFEGILELPEHELGVESLIFEMGVTSVDLIKIGRRIEESLDLSVAIPVITMLTNPTVRALAKALGDLNRPKEYKPVVTLQQKGAKTPLWLFHPGVGEVLVFLNLAKFIHDRPVHALRARGFLPGEPYFQSISEAVTTYYGAIKQNQPDGPYALAGYSYGSMLAFETAKVLESSGDEVRFLGCFNLPPHIKFRMRQLNWTECLLNLAYFVDLVSEQRARELSLELHTCDREEALAHVLDIADPDRMNELSLTKEAMENWVGLAFAMQSMATDYEPEGSVTCMDVFYCTPLATVSQSKEQWLRNHLSKWEGFCRNKPKFHEVDGAHYTMIGPAHVFSFQKTLQKVLQSRDL